jgi:cellulose synthase/poly-beta-1,6-N-acetylglucosamine synthase-like glycosyltransferase/exo-beta-1,3-glucanase (GH17 family)
VSYNRFEGRPAAGLSVGEDRIRADLAAIATQARAVRTYSSTHGLELVPGIATELGLDVTLGAWIDKNDARNEREIASALELAHRYPIVKRLVVGNETVFRHERTAEDLANILRRVKRDSPVPVATADHWKNFIDHPVLGEAVDEIFAHIIPYWEGFAQETAVEQSLEVYDRLRRAFPDKKIVIGEFGWPSAGTNFEKAVPSPTAQAMVLRDFVARANVLGLDYNIIEAIDQPQKLFEGAVGPYWGILDASLRPKFAWTGPVRDPDGWRAIALAVLVGLLLSISVLALPEATSGQAVVLAAVDHAIGDWGAHVVVYWHGHYLILGEAVAFAIAMPLLALLMPVVFARTAELAAVAFAGEPRRLLAAFPARAGTNAPKVSIHIPAYREPPEMLLSALDSVAQLNYPNFEAVVVINNTPDPAFWQPIEARVRELGERFKFVRVEKLEGFKAGALRVAMAHTAADAEIIGVIDADYVVGTDWLKDLVPAFADPNVGLVQAPQDHRDGDRDPLHAAMNAEYAGFFDIGMVERNEVDAIIAHGTMILIRRRALEAAGGWSSDTIVEDSDLGLTLLERGWRAHYTKRRYGWGLLPQDYRAFKMQRDRWAGGAVQIVKKHWRRFLPGASRLDADQKREYLVGWLTWFGAESLAVAAALLNLVFVPFVVLNVVALPDELLTIPVIAASAMSLVHFVLAYRMRVAVSVRHMLGAMFLFMSMQWTVARAAFIAALPAHGVYFHRTPKGGKSRDTRFRFPARAEAMLGSFLLAGAATVTATNVHRVLEADLFAAVLLLQSLPFWSAVGVAAFERIAARKRQRRMLPSTIVATATAFSLALGVLVGAHAQEGVTGSTSYPGAWEAAMAAHRSDPGRALTFETPSLSDPPGR